MFLAIEEKKKDKTALLDNKGTALTYGQLCDFSEDLRKADLGRCLVFVLCRNCTEAAAVYLASLDNRIVPLMLGAAIDAKLMDELLEKYKPDYIWKPEDMVSSEEDVKYSFMGYRLVSYCSEKCEMYDELSLLLPTSGSTGSPKLVRHSYENLEANARNIAAFFELTENDKPMLDLPIQYTYGLSVLNSHIYAGATVLLSELGLMQQEYWDFFKNNEATSITGVPYTYEMIKRFRILRMDLPSLKLISQGGGKLNEQLQRELAEFARDTDRKFIITYGQTEGSARMAYLPAEDALTRIGSIGKAIPGGKIRLEDEDGNEITQANREGELVYEGANVTLGYANSREELTLGDERRGVLHTGDIAKMDEDGYLYITGRKQRFLKLYGNRVSLDECEQLIKTHFDTECACIGEDNELKAFVTGSVEASDVRTFLSKTTGIHQKAFKVNITDELPRNEAGKILYNILQQL